MHIPAKDGQYRIVLWGWDNDLPGRSSPYSQPKQYYDAEMFALAIEGFCPWCEVQLLREFAQSDTYPEFAACLGCDQLWCATLLPIADPPVASWSLPMKPERLSQ